MSTHTEEGCVILDTHGNHFLVGPAVANAFMEDGDSAAPATPITSVTRNAAGQFLLESGNVKINAQALEEIQKQQALHDERLEQCREDGKNWDQCFFYGKQQQRSGSHFFQFDKSNLTKLHSNVVISKWKGMTNYSFCQREAW